MRKKYILALMATGVLPMSAFAAINVPGVGADDWDLSGVSNVHTDNDGITTVPGAQGGYPACTIKDLPAGEYKLAGRLSNAEFVVLINDQEVARGDNNLTFETEGGELVIKVTPIDMAASYTFGNISLVLDVDLDNLYDELKGMMPTGELTKPVEGMAEYENKTDGVIGSEVVAEYEALKATDTESLEAAIETFHNPASDKQIEVYSTFEEVKKKVAEYRDKFDAYENGVKNEDDEYTQYPIGTINGWVETLKENTEAYEENKAEINGDEENPGLQADFDELKAEYTEQGYADRLTAEIAAVQQAIDDTMAEIEKHWAAEGVQEGTELYQHVDMTAIEEAIATLEDEKAKIATEEQNYDAWLRKYQELTNAYINAQVKCNKLYNVEDEPARETLKEATMAELTNIYNTAVGNLKVEYGSEKCSSEDLTADKKTINDAIDALKAQYNTLEQALADELQALKDGSDLVEGVSDALDKVEINEDAYKENDLNEEKAKLKGKLDALQQGIDGIYASADELTADYINDQFTSDVNVLKAEVQDFAAKVEIANQLGALTTTLEKARTSIAENQNSKDLASLDQEYAVNVVDVMNGSYQSINAAIKQQQEIFNEDYKKVATGSLDNLKASIDGEDDSYLTNGLKMAADFVKAYGIVLPAKTAAYDLVNFINNNNPAFDVEVNSTLEGEGVDVKNSVPQKPFTDKAAEYKNFADNVTTVIKDARSKSPQNAFDAIETVTSKPKVLSLLTDIKNEEIAFLKEVIGAPTGDNEEGNPIYSNLGELQYALDDLKSQLDAIVYYAGYDAAEELYTNAEDALKTINTDFAAVPDEYPVVSETEPEESEGELEESEGPALASDEEVAGSEEGTTGSDEEPTEPEEVKTPAEQLNDINALAKALIADLQAVQNEIDKVVKNYNAWQDVCDKVQKIKDSEDDAVKYVEEESFSPAQDTWKGLIDKKVKRAQELKDEADTTYGDVEMLAKPADSNKTNAAIYTDELQDIQNWLDPDTLKDNVQKNEIAHNGLLDESAYVIGLVDDVNKFIENADDVTIENNGEDVTEILKGYVDELNALDAKLYEAYAALECDGQNMPTEGTLMSEYEALAKKINDLYGNLADDYTKALKEYNEQFIAENWDAIYPYDLGDVYTEAIIRLDEYRDAVKGCAPLAANEDIQDGIDHQPIYDYADQIQKLLDEVKTLRDNSWKDTTNSDGEVVKQHKLTKEELAPYIEDAERIIKEIGEIVSEKVEKMNAAAEKILDNLKGEVAEQISDAVKELKEAGCDQESIKEVTEEATKAYLQAEQVLKTPLEGTLQPAYIENIADAINAFEAVGITDAQKLKAAQDTFDTAVANVEKAIEDAHNTLESSTLPDSVKEAFQSELDAAAEELNPFKNEKVDLTNLQTELDKVNKIDVTTIKDAIDAAVAANVANNDNHANLLEEVAKVNATLDALNDWIEQLLVAADVPMTVLDAQIETVRGEINTAYEDKTLSDNNVVAALEDEIADLQNSIDETYNAAYKLEADRLSEEVLNANRAFNEKAKRYEEETGKTDYAYTPEGREWTKKIDAQALALGEINDAIDADPDLFPTPKQQQAILDIQTALLDIQVDLGALSADEVVIALDKIAENAVETIKEHKKALGNYAAEKYDSDYDALVAEVEALQEEWNENPTGAIVKEGVYKSKIEYILNNTLPAYDKAAAEWQADREANAAHEAESNAYYDYYNGEIEQYRQQYNQILDYTQTYADRLEGSRVYNYLSWINQYLAWAQGDLDSAKEKFTCATFNWDDYEKSLVYNINDANKALWQDVTLSYQKSVSKALKDAEDAISIGLENGLHFQDLEGLRAQLSSLRIKFNKLKVVSNGSAEAGEAYVEAANELISSAEALFKTILEAGYVPGDISGTGEVTADDYEALIELLGQIDDPKDFDNPAYDVDGDGELTSSDIAAIIDILMGGMKSDAKVMARMPMISTNNAIYVVKTSTSNDITRYALVLNNTAELFGAQMDIVLSNGMELVNEGVAERTSGHEFYGSITKSGKHRIILSSIQKSTFVGSEGAIVYIDVRGDGELSLDNVIGVDPAGRRYNINVMTNVTGIESISSDVKNADIYNVAGQKLNRAQRGAINIIRNADGKTSKVINK